PVVLFCQHSVTTEFDEAAEQVRPSLAALERLEREGVQVVITYPNNDAGGRRIMAELHRAFGEAPLEFSSPSLRRAPVLADAPPAARVPGCCPPRRAPTVQIHKSLGRYRFHGVLNLIGRAGRGAFAGNSSALIKETPVFGCPAVNIGSRQQGRL